MVALAISGGGNKAVIRANANVANVVVAGNSTVSNLTSNATEIVVSAVITKVAYGCPANSYWTVFRGANVVGVYAGTGVIDYVMNTDITANISANITGTQTGFIAIECTKQTGFSS